MIREGKIGFAEGFSLLMISNIARVFLNIPAIAFEEGNNMAWGLILIGTVNSLFTFWIIASLLKRHPDKTIVEASESILGPYLGTLVNLSFFLYFMLVVATLDRAYTEAILVAALPSTPLGFVLITLSLGAFISAYYGLEAMARVARASLPFIMLGIAILVITVIPFVDSTNIYPLWSMEPTKFLEHAFIRYTLVSEGLLAAVISHVFGGWRQFNRAGMLALAVGGFILMLMVFLILLIFGTQPSKESLLPVYQLSRIISIGRFFQRLESVFLLTWMMVGFIKLAVTFYAANVVLSRMLRLTDYRPLLWITGLLCISLSIIPPDLPTANSIENEYIRTYGLIPTAGLPLLLLVVSKLRKAGELQRDDAKTD